MAINKNFVIKNGLEVADQAFVVDASTDRIGIGTTSAEYSVDARGDVAFSGILLVSAEDTTIDTRDGIADSVNRNFISGIDTSNVRVNDTLYDGFGGIIESKVISVGISSLEIYPNHNRLTGSTTRSITISRRLFAGNSEDVLVSRGENLPPVWRSPVGSTPIRESSSPETHYPAFVTGTGATTPLINETNLVFIPASGNLGIGSTIPQTTLDVSGQVNITGGENITGILTATEVHVGESGQTLFASSSSGKVGINSTIPTETLDVDGNIKSSSSITAISYFGDGVNLSGIVTQITAGIGISLTPSIGKGTVQVESYRPIGKTIYVSQNGDDLNTGLSENHTKRTIKAATAIALPGDTIKVFPGVYVENNPIVLGKNVAVEGTELRNCIVTPQNSGEDLFHVNNSVHITDLSFVGSASTNGASIVAFTPLSGVSSDRFFDAARMIRMNLDFIAAEAVEYINSTSYQNPIVGIDANEYKNYIKSTCLAVCHDITRGGNSKSVGVGLSFYTGGVINTGIGTTTIDALRYAAGIAKSCINNVLWTGAFQNEFSQVRDVSIQADPVIGSNIDINSCSNVISALYSCVGVVTTIIDQSPTILGVGINTTYPGNSGIGTTNPNDPSYSPGVGPITQGPYIRNCTNFIPNSIGMKVDGFDAEPGDQLDIGVTGSMSVDSYTQYNQGGIGVSITNGAYAQLVSIFTICDDVAIYTAGGGQCDINNSNASFGNYGLVSDGIGYSSSKSIYRYTGNVNAEAASGQSTVKVSGIGSFRPYDGQVVYFDQIYYTVNRIEVTNGGTGYVISPRVIIDAPTGPEGIQAEAIAIIENGSVIAVDIISTGNQYATTPNVTFDNTGTGGSNAAATAFITPIYYTIERATKPHAGISTIILNTNLNNTVGVGTTAYFSRLSLQLATTISFEWVGSGTNINTAKPALGGVTIRENEVDKRNGGQVVYTSTNQSGNFNIGDDIVINQLTGTITGRSFSQSILNTVTPLIIALGN